MLFAKILVAYDGSNLSKKALNKALQLSGDSLLEVIHVYNFPSFVFGEAYITAPVTTNMQYAEHAQQVLDEAKSLVFPTSNVAYELRQGDAARTILDYAEETKADLIVIGSRGLGGIREFVLGSVSHNIVQHSKIPVLVVK